jgi:predicted TIM-barrel fold metal-dependent hydrolase
MSISGSPESGETRERPIEPDLPIIDTHHHLWIVPPFGGMEPFPIEQLAAERAASGHDVFATVFVDCQRTYLENASEAMRVIGETRTVDAEAAAAERAGGTMRGLAAAIVSRADMRLAARVEDVLVAHLAESPTRFRGIRHMAPWHLGMDFFGLDTSEHMMRSSAFCAGVACLARLNLSFDAWVMFTQLDDVAYLARAVPQATIILDHAGTPLGVGPYADKADDVFNAWKRGMMDLAQCPNVVVKIGGLLIHNTGLAPHQPAPPMTSKQVATALRRYVLTTIDIFSPDRCMFESNFPVDRYSVSYGNLWNGFKRLASDFARNEREALFAGTARRAYRL